MPVRPQTRPIPLLLAAILLAIALPLGSDAINPQAQRFDETRDPLVAAAWKQDATKVRDMLRQAAGSGPVTRKNLWLLANRAAPDLGSPSTKRAMWTPLWAVLLSIEASTFSAARNPDALAVVDLLLQAGADPRAAPPPGWTEAPDDTALHYAARLTQNPEIVRLLMVAASRPGSASVGSGGSKNSTAASSSWINHGNSKGNTPLFAAVSCDWRVSGGDAAAAKVVRMLLAAGADASVCNKRGCPALEVVPSPCTASTQPQPRYQGAEGACQAFAPLQKRGGDVPTVSQVREAWSRAPSSASPEGGNGGSAFCPETFAVLRAAAPKVRGRDGRVMGPVAGELLMPCDA